MYEIKYVNAAGKSLDLSLANGFVIKTIDGITDHSIDLSLSQGFQQVGESLDAATVKGRSITVKGVILDGNTAAQKRLMDMIAPLSIGRLWWQGNYWIDVVVQNTPYIQQTRHAQFNFRLYAAYPFWKYKTEQWYQLGGIIPSFAFPINYSTTHRFGSYAPDTFINCKNRGNISVGYRLEISGTEDIVNPEVVNINTFELVKFNGTLTPNQKLSMYQAAGVLKVTITEDGVESDAFDLLDDSSDLFMIAPGDNVLRRQADSGANTMVAALSFFAAYSGVVNGM